MSRVKGKIRPLNAGREYRIVPETVALEIGATNGNRDRTAMKPCPLQCRFCIPSRRAGGSQELYLSLEF
jgi:hypothetical protein